MKIENPPLSVLLGPARSAKTRDCLRRFREAEGRALLLVPTRDHADRLKETIRSGESAGGDGIMTFGELISRLADSEKSGRGAISRTFQRLILAEVFATETEPEDYFGRMHGTPGFIGALADCIRELKLSGISPEDLAAATEAASERIEDPQFARRAGEIARLYGRYQAFLHQHHLLDEEDLPRIATENVKRGAPLPHDARIVIVDGFYRFSRVWRELLAALAARKVEIAISLLHDSSRPLLFATPLRTLESLRTEFTVQVTFFSQTAPNQPAELQQLERGLFAGEGVQAFGRSGVQDGAGGWPEGPNARTPERPLRIFDAPNTYVEVEMVARALRREHDEQGTPWGKCAIFLRTLGGYGPILEGVCEKIGVPLTMQQPTSVADNPLVKTILTLLNVFLYDWRRDDVIAFLKSSYTSADKLRADSLRRQARKRGLREGRERWMRLAAKLNDEDDPLARTLVQMLEWDRRLLGRNRTADEFVKEIGEMRGKLELNAPPPRGGEESPEALALGQAGKVLEDIALTGKLVGRGAISFAEFYRQVLAGWQGATYCPPLDPNKVAVLEPYDARRREATFAAVIGLTERVFPRRIMEDPFFRDDEREALSESAGLLLEGQQDRADDERLLFYLAATAPAERLVLSFPRSADEADTLPSFYLDEVRACFDHVATETRTLADVAPRPEECLTKRDRLLAACASQFSIFDFRFSNGGPLSDSEKATVASILATTSRPQLPRLEEGPLRQAFSAARRYSISEIETYNTCPFQHFMKYGLNLRPDTDGGGPADKGTIYHAALRKAFRRRAASQEKEELREILAAELEECLAAQAVDAAPHRRRMMERALADAMTGFVERESRYAELFGMTPTHFELAFGQEEPAASDDGEIDTEAPRDYDPASTPQPLTIPGADGGPPIYLCGAIDRVDLAPNGRAALVMDYKLGSSVEFPAIKEGKSLQMPLYLMAIEQLWGKVGAVGCYDSPRDGGRSRFFRVEHVDGQKFRPVAGVESGKLVKPVGRDEYAETIQAAQEAVRRAVAGIASANVLPTPGPLCAFCDYGDVCRTSRDNVHDGEPMSSLPTSPDGAAP